MGHTWVYGNFDFWPYNGQIKIFILISTLQNIHFDQNVFFPQFCYDINQRKNIIWIFQILLFSTLPNILYTGYFWTQGNSIVQTAHCKMSVHIIWTCWLQICKTLQLFLQSVKTWTLTANRKKCWGLPKTYDFVSNAMERRPLLQFQ